MVNLTKFIFTSLLLAFVYGDLKPESVQVYNVDCPTDSSLKCDVKCPNENYLLDEKGCPTCKCVPKAKVECSRVMCRMYCQHGFKRDENGCEYCSCNQSPQECPKLNCENSCSKGYRKDYSGCQTCDCECPAPVCPASSNNCKFSTQKDAEGCPICSCEDGPIRTDEKCIPLDCDLQCKYGLQRNERGCKICSCNRCPMRQCRMYCMYGFRKNEDDGCDICECDWTPVAEKIQCDERISCPGTRVCNLNLRLCELVNPDRVNWFLYDFEVEDKDEIFKDDKFIQTFKNGLIHNIAAKYGLEISQIAVSSVEQNGLTSFQIMPFFSENMDNFEQKMDQIDVDLNSHEFRALLPAITRVIEDSTVKHPSRVDLGRWCGRFRSFLRSKPMFFTMTLIIAAVVLIIVIGHICIRRRRVKLSIRSESKTPIYDTSYQLASTDDDYYHSVSAPDGTKYVIVASDDFQSSNDKRALV